MKNSSSIITDNIRNRRSIYPKQYSGERVSDDVINEMLENANWAPTHRLTEPWRFVVFCDKGLLYFADFQAKRYKETSGDNFQEEKYLKLKEKPLLCSHIIAIGLKRNPIVPEMEEIAAVAAAVQNMQLTATAHGIACYWSTGGTTFDEGAKSFFGLEKEDKLLGFLNVGMPREDCNPKSKRKPMTTKIEWVK